MLAGNDVEEGAKTVMLTKKVTAPADGVIAIADAEAVVSVMMEADGGSGEEVEDNVTNGYQFATGSLTLAGTALVEGAQYIIFYTKEVTDATTVTFNSNDYPSTYRVVANTLVRNEKDGKDHAYQINIPKAKLLPGITITLDPENPSTFTFNLDVLQDTNGKKMVELIRY